MGLFLWLELCSRDLNWAVQQPRQSAGACSEYCRRMVRKAHALGQYEKTDVIVGFFVVAPP